MERGCRKASGTRECCFGDVVKLVVPGSASSGIQYIVGKDPEIEGPDAQGVVATWSVATESLLLATVFTSANVMEGRTRSEGFVHHLTVESGLANSTCSLLYIKSKEVPFNINELAINNNDPPSTPGFTFELTDNLPMSTISTASTKNRIRRVVIMGTKIKQLLQ